MSAEPSIFSRQESFCLFAIYSGLNNRVPAENLGHSQANKYGGFLGRCWTWLLPLVRSPEELCCKVRKYSTSNNSVQNNFNLSQMQLLLKRKPFCESAVLPNISIG